MRRELLKRIWSKEFRQMDTRSGSWSPPLRRSQRRLNIDPVAEKCIECSKLELEYSNCALTSDATLVTAAEERITSSEATTITISAQLTSNTDDRFDTKMDSPNISHCSTPDYSIAIETLDDNQNSTNTFSHDLFIRSNITTDEPHSTPDTIDRYDSALPTSSNETAFNQNGTLRSNSQDNPTSLPENFQVDNKQYHRSIANVDQYIANLLIDSLNNVLATTDANIEYFSSERDNNNFSSGQSNVKTTAQRQENINSIDSIYNQTEMLPENATDIGQDQEVSIERIIYFPRYGSINKESASGSSSMLTEDEQDMRYSMKASYQQGIPVQSGSNYPSADFVVSAVSRIVQRTESMEAQRASSSPYNCDSDTSLIDSLDDPHSPRPDDSKQTPAEPPYEKSQTFFVPIQDVSEHKVDESINMASAMPERLREKMKKRLLDMDMRKTSLNTRKIKKIEKKKDKSIKENRTDSSLTTTTDSGSKNLPFIRPTKVRSKLLQSEIGLLETYTIDRQGNMKFQPVTKAKKANKIKSQTSTSSSSISSRRQVIKKPVQPRRSEGTSVKNSSQTRNPTNNNNRRRKEVQQLTLYQSDLMTPDTECGPRRMYQKTEIHDGKKRIEILEIVECIDSSSSSNEGPIHEEQISSFQTEKQFRRSKIPVPVFKSGKGNSKKHSKIFVKTQNIIEGGASNSKVDQMIANLLIEALNNPKNLSIGFVSSPADTGQTLTPNTANTFSKNGRILEPPPPNSSSRRLNSGAIKYHQVFDVIPEEKSSISVDSSTDDGIIVKNKSLKECKGSISTTSSAKRALSEEASSVTESSDSSESQSGHKTRGKEGVESESESAWLGFLKSNNESNHEGTTRVGVLLFA